MKKLLLDSASVPLSLIHIGLVPEGQILAAISEDTYLVDKFCSARIEDPNGVFKILQGAPKFAARRFFNRFSCV